MRNPKGCFVWVVTLNEEVNLFSSKDEAINVIQMEVDNEFCGEEREILISQLRNLYSKTGTFFSIYEDGFCFEMQLRQII